MKPVLSIGVSLLHSSTVVHHYYPLSYATIVAVTAVPICHTFSEEKMKHCSQDGLRVREIAVYPHHISNGSYNQIKTYLYNPGPDPM